ncbi:MAG: hypothetical protein JNL08_20700 [Planctomycetes bacterium]|nr:hypothetical protein [Planctomycetota bacterium]
MHVPHFVVALGLLAATLSTQEGARTGDALRRGDPVREAAARAAVRAEVAQRYAAAAWPRGTRRPGLAFDALQPADLRSEEFATLDGGLLRGTFVDRDGRSRVVVEAVVGGDADAAQAQLVAWLSLVSRPGTLPRADAEGMPVGDIGFVGWSKPAERRVAWLAFVRDNVAVRVSSCDPSADPHPDLLAIAQSVDAAVLREPVLAAEAPLPRPTVRRFEAAPARCRAGAVVPLVLQTEDPAGGAARCAFTLTGPGQGYVEADPNGGWRLHTTGPGTLTIDVLVTGSRGTTATARCVVDVSGG